MDETLPSDDECGPTMPAAVGLSLPADAEGGPTLPAPPAAARLGRSDGLPSDVELMLVDSEEMPSDVESEGLPSLADGLPMLVDSEGLPSDVESEEMPPLVDSESDDASELWPGKAEQGRSMKKKRPRKCSTWRCSSGARRHSSSGHAIPAGGCAPAAAVTKRTRGKVNTQEQGQAFEFVVVLSDGRISDVPLPPIPVARCSLKILELFSGTGSVGMVFELAGHTVVSVDITDKGGRAPTHQANILHRRYQDYLRGTFVLVWASPPCEDYSIARTTATMPRDLAYADSLVVKTLEIIGWLNPAYFVIENPQSGLLKTRGILDSLPWVDVDYCMYGAPYRKRTRLWGRLPLNWQARRLCQQDCHACGNNKKHRSSAQRGSGWSLNQLHRIPPLLVRELLIAISS